MHVSCAQVLQLAGHPPVAPLLASNFKMPRTVRHVLITPSEMNLTAVIEKMMRVQVCKYINIVYTYLDICVNIYIIYRYSGRSATC